MLKDINIWPIVFGVAMFLLIFVSINAWHIKIKWSEEHKRFCINYKSLVLICEIDHKEHFEFENRVKKLPKFLNIFRWKKNKKQRDLTVGKID